MARENVARAWFDRFSWYSLVRSDNSGTMGQDAIPRDILHLVLGDGGDRALFQPSRQLFAIGLVELLPLVLGELLGVELSCPARGLCVVWATDKLTFGAINSSSG